MLLVLGILYFRHFGKKNGEGDFKFQKSHSFLEHQDGPGSDGQFILYSCYRALGTGTAMLSYGTLLTIYKTYILMYCTINPNRQ